MLGIVILFQANSSEFGLVKMYMISSIIDILLSSEFSHRADDGFALRICFKRKESGPKKPCFQS